MINVDRIIIGLFALVFIAGAIAFAGQSSVPITPGTGANFGVVTTASGSNVSMQVVCDQAAAASCATVNGNALSVGAAESGTWNVGVTGTVSTSPTVNTPITGNVGVTGTVTVSTASAPIGIVGTVSTSPTGTTPVQGTVTSNQGTAGGAAWAVGAAESGTWNVGITGTVATSPTVTTPITGSITNTVTVSTASAPIGIAGTVSTSPTGTTPVQGTVTANQGTAGGAAWAVGAAESGTWNVGITGTATVSTASAPIGIAGTVTVSTANAPITIAGTVSTSPTGNVNVVGVNGFGIGSLAGAVPTTSAPYQAGRASNAEPTAGSNGNLIGLMADLVGKLVVSPYANKENYFSYTASSTTSSGTGVTGTNGIILVPAQGANLYPYITSLSCFNTAATSQVITIGFSNTGTTISTVYRFILGAGISNSANLNATFVTPLGGVFMGTANANVPVIFKGTDGGAAFTGLIGCNATGYKGT